MFAYYLDLAVRSLKRNKVLTALMVIAIAVGIGASMTTLTVMHLLSGDPLPGRSQHIFYPQVDPDPSADQREPYDMLDYRSAMDLWSAHRADRQALIAHGQMRLTAPQVNLPPLMAQVLSTTSDWCRGRTPLTVVPLPPMPAMRIVTGWPGSNQLSALPCGLCADCPSPVTVTVPLPKVTPRAPPFSSGVLSVKRGVSGG